MTTTYYSDGTFVVPATCTSLIIECWGEGTGHGVLGGYAKGTVTVTPNETLYVHTDFGGGANSGGGAADVRRGGDALANRIMVGAGAGQSAYYMDGPWWVLGGHGGGLVGGDGDYGPYDGGGATQTAGGKSYLNPGTLGYGGSMGSGTGGGGGGGLYGGGGGGESGSMGSGGGGSSYTTGTNTVNTAGVNVGAGYVTITIPNTVPNAPTQNTPATSAILDLALTQRFGWTPSDPDAGDTQTKFDLQYRAIGAGSWTLVSQSVANQYWDAPPNTFTANDYEWQVRTYDAAGLVGPYCSSRLFTAVSLFVGWGIPL